MDDPGRPRRADDLLPGERPYADGRRRGYDPDGYDRRVYESGGHGPAPAVASGREPFAPDPARTGSAAGFPPAAEVPGGAGGGYADPGQSGGDGTYLDPAVWEPAAQDPGGDDQRSYGQGTYDHGGHDQGGYDQAGYDQGGYDADGPDLYPDDRDPAWDDPAAHTAGAAEPGAWGSGYGEDPDGYGVAGVGVRTRTVHGAPRRPRRRHPILAGLLVILVVVVVVVASGIYWATKQINPGGRPGPAVTVTITKGESTAAIGAELAHAHVIHGSGTLFRYWARFQSIGPLLTGTYRLPTNESYQRVVSVLEAGPPSFTDKLVIPEGFTLHQIAARIGALPGLHVSAASVLAAAADGSVRSPYEPPTVNNLEGLVFPATYQIQSGSTASDILTEMVQAFDQRATSIGLTAAAARLKITPYQLITVASIVQGEAKRDVDRPGVASAIYNRLAVGMTLGADSTLIYELRQKHPDIDINAIDYNQPNPYNTRIHKGLPPTPISNPGLPSLAAAASPPHTTYLYWVEVSKDGRLGFASDTAGFETLVAECRAAGLDC